MLLQYRYRILSNDPDIVCSLFTQAQQQMSDARLMHLNADVVTVRGSAGCLCEQFAVAKTDFHDYRIIIIENPCQINDFIFSWLDTQLWPEIVEGALLTWC